MKLKRVRVRKWYQGLFKFPIAPLQSLDQAPIDVIPARPSDDEAEEMTPDEDRTRDAKDTPRRSSRDEDRTEEATSRPRRSPRDKTVAPSKAESMAQQYMLDEHKKAWQGTNCIHEFENDEALMQVLAITVADIEDVPHTLKKALE